jgi:FdhD protein
VNAEGDPPIRRIAEYHITKVIPSGRVEPTDQLAVEEPLEIRLAVPSPDGLDERPLAVTMRTPGDDEELVTGFLLTEGIIRQRQDLHDLGLIARNRTDSRWRATLAPGVSVDWERLERHFYTTASCGVCGKTAIAAVETQASPVFAKDGPLVPAAVIHALPARLWQAQEVFAQTGGLHAAALFNADGVLLAVREDVGRHNALDKVIGWALMNDRLPLSRAVLMVSGRASFELVQKALMAGIPILAAVGAPSSLAVDLADEFDQTLLGFVRADQFNVYSGGWRVSS